ncbi:MAG: hypothetical protein U0263_38955, partial [Polyangiaceae bacterium]
EACKILTERANLAGGHDNITVIVAKFEGEALSAPAAEDVVKYTKYALPDSGEVGTRPSVKSIEDVSLGPVSDEAQRESRRLKVGHTLIGMTTPVLEGADAAPPTAPQGPRYPSNPPPVFSLDDEPVQIPTTGLPPSAVGALVVGALVVVSVIGFFLLR